MSDILFDQESPSQSSPSQSSPLNPSIITKLKSKYIHKINNIQHHNQSPSKNLNKKQRNKQSAKQCRDRKKLYVQILEEKQVNLRRQLESRKRQLEETRGYLQRVVNQNKTMSGFTASRHQMIKNIQGLLVRAKNGQDPSQQINQVIQSLRYNIGATGRQRVNTINQYFHQIVNLSLPALHRYMMWSAFQGKHLFGMEEEQDQWFVQLKNALNLTQEQKREIQSKREFLRAQKMVLEGLIGDLRDVKNRIEEKSMELEGMIDGIRAIMTPVQAAHFILFIQKNKYRKELNLCQASLVDPTKTQ